MQAGVPIVPAVSIGGQETQLFLTLGTWLAKRLGLKRIRMEILPVTIGFPSACCDRSGQPAVTAKIVYDGGSRSTSPPGSARTPTSMRSTPTCVR